MSYTTLSQQTGISRTGISHHFPKKTDFTAALDGRIFQMFVEHVDFEHDIDAFTASWVSALDNKEFIAILRLLFHHIVTSQSTHEFARNGVERLYAMTEAKFGQASSKQLEWLIGKSLLHMAA